MRGAQIVETGGLLFCGSEGFLPVHPRKGVYLHLWSRRILDVSSTDRLESETQMSIAQTVDARFARTELHEQASGIGKPCGHLAHGGTCASCQRSQLARWRSQLAQVSRSVR